MSTSEPRADSPLDIRYIPLVYDPKKSNETATRLIEALLPEWQRSEGPIEFVHFTDGITNTVRLNTSPFIHQPPCRLLTQHSC